jgi:L-amino acid N-acyltransferase YncA
MLLNSINKMLYLDNISDQNYKEVAAIYKQGIDTGIATFQNEVPIWEEWNKSHLSVGRIAAYQDGSMVGWASLSPVSNRCVYGGVAEVSVYIATESRGKGVGKFLLQNLVNISEQAGLWTLQSGIFSENLSSIKLHESCGFRIVGYREKIGAKDGVWKDNVIMERRSKVVGF